MFETDFFPLAKQAKDYNLVPDSLDHLQENTASPSLQDWGQAPGSKKLPEFRPDESRLKVFSALALGDAADEGARKLVKAEGYQAPATPDEEACLGLDVCVSLFGLDQAADPYLYWARQGKEAPQFKDMGEAHRAVWQDFSERTRVEDAAYKERVKRVQQEQEEISRRMVDCVAGKEGDWDACPADLLKYAERPQEAADSIMRARRAYAFVKRRGFEDVWRSDALDMADLLTVNSNGNEVLDQQALMLLMTAIDRKVQESQTDSAAFWRNLYRSFADTARGAESLGVKAVQAVRGIPGMSGMEEWYSNNIAPLQGVKDTFDGQRQLFDRYEQRREALNTMQDVMHEFGQRMRGTSPDASWYVKAINGAGNITGQSLSYMAPGGWALALAGDMGHAGNAASRNGDSLVDVTINGLRNTVEEKGFGVFSVFGRMGAINKLMTRTGTGALARLAAKVPGRTFFAGTRTGKMLSTPAFAYVEEMAAEPLAGELFEWTARKLSGMTGMEVKPKDFEVVGPVLQAMGDVEQSGGCALFVAAMAAGHAPRMKQEVAAFVTDAQRAQLAGYTKKHAEEMASFSTAEHKAALAQKYFETDVLKDPEGAAERARKAGAELADRQEARLYQMSGALDKVLEKANIGRIRKLEGTDRYEVSLREGAVVNGVKMEEDRSVEMNEEQTDALVQVVLQGAYLNGVRVMQDAVLGNAAISEAGKMDFIETLDMLSEEAPAEYRKAAAETGGMTVPGLMDVAARAQARIDAIVREEGVSVQEARSRTDAEVMGKVQLGSIADLAAAFERRLDHAVRSGEITRGRSEEIRNGTAAASFAHRFTMATDPGSSLLLYAGGHATTANVMEDVQESALVHYMNLTGKDWQDLWEHLQAADAVLGRYGVSLGTYEGPAHDARDVVESFSNLSLSSSLADIESLPVPQWVKDTAEFALKNLEDSARIIRMGEQWNEFAATDEGKKFMEEHGGLADALQAVGVSTESVFRQARMDAAQKLDVEMVHADLASRRAPGDATMTLGELEALEESMARMDAAEDVEETAEEEDETDPVTGIAGNPASPAPLVEDAGGSLEGVGEEAEHDEEAGAEFRDHAFVRVAPDCVFAQVRVDSLALAPDVEQFKQGDHNERGAVKGRELQGRFREDAQPISVWRRRDGALHVITGRHRFDLAVRDGVEFIPAYVYEEDDAHDATWAKMHDVGQNMLDGQASALEVAFFVRNSNMGRDEMEAQGYLRPGSANVMGWDIATLAGDEVFTRLKNGVITDNEAWKVCHLSSTEAGQMLALQLREKGKPWDYVAAYVKEADRVAAEKSREGEAFDLFGNDTSWQEDCEKVARFAARGIALIAERLSLLKKSRGISRRKDLAGRMGIRLETDADLNAAIHDLERAKGAWQSHDPALRLHDRALAWDGTSEVNPFERVPVSGATFSVVAMDSSGTVLAPETFVTREDGSPDWFVIPRRKRQPAMPVRLLVGSDIGEHRGYGLTHILASRGFSFWKDRSPERYISSILANVRELYEVAPGRELLVKGRQPSSWMLLQLDRKDGFYSIVSAYPVRQGKKPLGKKIPLAERQPANANSGTARLGPGSASKAALPSQSAGGGDDFSLPQGAHVVNVNEVECRFDDGAIVPATFSLSLEKEAIKKEAVAAGTFMKAPNGKETKLTEDQWLAVRTAAFKNWFGDWEHDPQNASKVVDENGEPRVVYHGTDSQFTVFDSSKVEISWYSHGFYFSDKKSDAKSYGDNIVPVFLNIRNPFMISKEGWFEELTLEDKPKKPELAVEAIATDTGNGFFELQYRLEKNGEWISPISMRRVSPLQLSEHTPLSLVNYFLSREYNNFLPRNVDSRVLQAAIKEAGHDGVIGEPSDFLHSGKEYVAYEPTQIKSATDNRGTFDSENPDITFSVIGPNAATWGKYVDKAFAGRDDGKLRAEIDASQAQLKTAPGMPYLSRLDLLAEDIRYLKNPRKEGVLSDYLDYSELYDAYPRLKKMSVYVFKDRNRQEAGWYDPQDDSIAINLSSLGPLWNQRSTLLHEIQHAIQEYEGFAEGGDSGFAERVLTYQRNRITGDIIAKTRRRSWLLARDAALDALGRIRRLIRNPKAIKKMSERFAVHEVMDVDVMARQAIELLLKEYNKLVAQDAEYGKLTMGKDAEGCELPICYAGMLLRGGVNVDAVTIEQIDRQIEMVKATVSRKMRFPGEEKRIWQELEKLYRGKEAVVRQLKDLEPFDLYQRLAGEIEARNVEKRRDMTAREREAVPFNDTLEFPGEAIVSFSIASAQEQDLFHDGHFEAGNAVITEPGVTFSITALHASPHSFRKFDTAFMGKGEGAQAYGWGLYFAENPEVNRAYMDRFSQNKETLIREIEAYSERKFYSVHSDLIYTLRQLSVLYPDKVLADGLRQYINTESVRVKKRREEAGDDVPNYMAHILKREEEKLKDLQQILNWIHSGGELSAEMLSASNYRVELNVDDSVLLNWDRPVPENLRALMQSSPVEAVRELAGALSTNRDGTKYWTYQDYTGEAIYKKLMDDLFMDRPRSEVPDKNGRQKAASLALLDSGIKGIRYADGYTRGKAEEEQTYNYVIFDGNDIKITAFADESTEGAWADYVDPTASFSLATRESVWVTLEREAQKNRLEVLRSQTAKALETWRRVCAANDVKQGDGAEAFGRVMAVVASIYKTLPEGYRFGLYPYMRAAENLATRLEDGQAWLSDELKKETLMDDTSERMDAVIDKLLARTLEQADRYAVDQIRSEMVARIKAVQPTKKASGKFNKGKLSAEDYRHLHRIVAMMNTDQEAKEKRMLELEGVLSSNQSTEEERDAAELELKDWHTFGYLAGMGLEQTRACARALALFITTGRTAWSTRLDEERRRTKFKAEKIVEGLGQATPQGGRDAEEDAKASTRTKAAKYLKYGLQSYSQLLNGWKKIPALRGLAHAEVTAIAEANVALRNMKHARDREVTALVKRCFGVQRTKDVARVLSDFKKTGDSGVVLNPLVKVERTVRIAEAREWVGLSFEEREERRKAIRKEYNDRGLSDDKASVPEALIPEMRRQLAELDELVKAGDGRARRRKNITAKAEVVRPGRKGETLKVSRAQAMYAILLYEQAEYVETMRNEGIGEAEVARLREFVGAEGLAFGYGLRELMNRQGKLLARVYEEREGVPFPAVENYFRAVFRADHKLDTKASFGEQTNAVAGGAKYGMLIPRRKHNLHLAWNMDCEAVFQAASAEVENYICTADITARWRGILADKEAAASLKEHMGRHGIDSLRHWLDVIDGAGVMEGGALLAGAQATSRFQSAKAVALLAWNVLTMLKQTSGLMHGMFAGEVGMGSFLLHLGQTMSMTGRMGVFEMMKTEAFRARTNDAQAELVSQLMGYASDQNYTGAIRFSMAGMRAIEKMDVWSNAVSMAALYNAKWSELEEAGKRTGAPMTEDEMHALCMQSVTRALELVAQPLTQSQKSMLGASTGLFAKMACFMSSEVLNKVGMIVSHVSSGNWGQALALYGMMSVAEQTVIALWHALLDDEDEWEKNGGWFGAMLGAPVAMIGGVPMLGAAVEFGYKQATGQRIYAGTASGVIDYSAIYRAAKNTWKAATGEKEMTFADWAELILLDAKAAAYVAGAGAGSRSKAADSVASWLLSVAGVANLSKPGFKLAE